MPKRPPPKIVTARHHPEVITGIYLLFQDRKLVYVGRSQNIYQRMEDHRMNGRSYDYGIVVEVPLHDSMWIERALIAATGVNPSQQKSGGGQPATRIIERLIPGPPPPRPLPEIMSPAAASEYLWARGVKLSTELRAALAAGEIPIVWRGKARQILRVDVEQWALVKLGELGFATDKLNRLFPASEI